MGFSFNWLYDYGQNDQKRLSRPEIALQASIIIPKLIRVCRFFDHKLQTCGRLGNESEKLKKVNLTLSS